MPSQGTSEMVQDDAATDPPARKSCPVAIAFTQLFELETPSVPTSQQQTTAHLAFVYVMANLSWTPPPWSSLDFTRDCTLYSKYAASYFRHGEKGIVLATIVEYFWSALPPGFRPGPTSLQIIEWYDSLVFNNSAPWIPEVLNNSAPWNREYQRTIYDAMGVCKNEFCAAIAIQGNSDMAGVVASYYVEAALVTLYFIVLPLARLVQRHSKAYMPSIGIDLPSSLQRLTDAFRGSLSVITDSAAVLSLAMLTAAIFTTMQFDSRQAHRDWVDGSALSAYDVELATIVSTFSIFPVVILGSLTSEGGGSRRKWLRRWLLLVLYALLVTQMILVFMLHPVNITKGLVNGFHDCASDKLPIMWDTYFTILFLIICTAPPAALLITLCVGLWHYSTRREGGTGSRWSIPGWYKRTLRLCSKIACFGMMWVQLGVLVYFRGEVIKQVADDPEAKWAFGQVLALSTWAPVVVEFGYILIFGMKHGLDERLPRGYQAVPSAEQEDGGGESDGDKGNGSEGLGNVRGEDELTE
ncbi:hypothetical protein DL767_008136 [Monosporascus sp. MG133]|nr:hypothetical protein DL767_008136 [Monosporascus sp. MG133]